MADQNIRRLGAVLLASIALALALVAFNSRGEPSELAVKAVKQTAGLQVHPVQACPVDAYVLVLGLKSLDVCVCVCVCARVHALRLRLRACTCVKGTRAQARQGMCQEDHRQRQAAQAPARAGQGRE
jgi:hypothetical protein